jgi:aromatic ring-opening dioxygenase catalytic subunit (LigB family)
LMDEGVDIASAAEVTDPVKAGFGHAYGFVIHRLLPKSQIPVVPIMLNTYFPPNVPRPGRCYDVGRALRRTIESLPQDKRFAIVASGGLSHFHTDSELDERVLEAMRTKDDDVLRHVPMAALRSGSSEILNWILAAGALEGLQMYWADYVPVYRTPAGTGIGLAFALWKPPGEETK